MDAGTLKQFEDLVQQEVPGFRLAYKDESRVQALIGFLVSPFNPQYMSKCSTFSKTVYFPSRRLYAANPNSSFSLLASEFVHVSDAHQDKLYVLKYLCPQILAVVPLVWYATLVGRYTAFLAFAVGGYLLGTLFKRWYKPAFLTYVVFGVLLTLVFSWQYTGVNTLVLAGLIVVAPWPSPWRVRYELNSYTMNIALVQWLNGSVSELTKEHLVNRFTGPEHYYMCYDRQYVARKLEMNRQQAQAGVLQRLAPFGFVFDFLYWRRQLHRMRPKP